jgi:hypothetical protein
MKAKVSITVSAHQYVPSDSAARVAWLEQFGVPPSRSEVEVEAELSTWEKGGASISATGEVAVATWTTFYTKLVDYAARRFAAGERDVSLANVDVHAVAKALEVEQAAKIAADAETRAREETAAIEAVRQIETKGLDAILRLRDRRWESTFLPDSAARVAQVKKALGTDAYARADAEADRRNAELEKEEARVRAPFDAACRTVAARYDDLARAAAEGYGITSALLDRLASTLDVANTFFSKIHSKVWPNSEDRAAPTSATFAMRDQIAAAVKSANETLPPELGSWTVSRIVRVDVCPHRGEEHYITCVTATLETPFATRQVTFSLEPLECEHE